MTTEHITPEPPGGTGLLGGRRVARIGFGVMQLEGQPHGWDAAVAVLRSAVEQGVNHLDTAQFYGSCNELIRAALQPYPAGLVLVSKVGAERDPQNRLVPAQQPAQLRASVEANLASLGTERLDVVNLRRLDEPPGIIAEGGQRVDLDSQLAEMIALRDEGKIGGIGLSNVSPAQLDQAVPAGVVCVQNSHSLLDRASEPVLDRCREHQVAWVPYCPLGSAIPGWPKVTEHPGVIAAAAALGATPAQVGLAWELAHYPGTLLIPGTANPGHLAENIAAGDVHLDPGTVATLDGLATTAGAGAGTRPGVSSRPVSSA